MGEKRRAALGQLELFSGGLDDRAPVPSVELPPARAPETVSVVPARQAETRAKMKPPNTTPLADPVISDEWWTTRMVCTFLKISRKTLWERRRNATLEFPRPVNLGGSRNVYRASNVRAWADAMALAELCDQV